MLGSTEYPESAATIFVPGFIVLYIFSGWEYKDTTPLVIQMDREDFEGLLGVLDLLDIGTGYKVT